MSTRAFTIHVPGKPVAQPRQRMSARGGIARSYLPNKHPIHAFKAAVRLAAKGCPVFEKDVPLRVIIVLHFAMPTTWSKRKREQKRGKGNTQKPDFDNLAKAVCDALADHYHDDAQICKAIIEKYWDDENGTAIKVEEINE